MRETFGRLLAAALGLTLGLAARPAGAETTICTVISSLPYTSTPRAATAWTAT